MSTTDTMAMRPLLFPDDTQFWYETLRALGHTAYSGADIGEVVTTAQRITANDYFTDAEGACAHCQVGAQRLLCARMLDWLDETLAGSGARPASSRP